MKTWNQFYRAAAGMLAMILVAGLAAPKASAQRVTILSTEGFTSDALPSGWSGNWGSADNTDWFWSSAGEGGYNGAAMDDIWDYNYTPLATPAENVSSYTNSSDSVWVDFDFFWEYNGYDPDYSSFDHINIDANSDVLVDGTVTTLYTYYNISDYNFDVAQTSASDWRHYHILIPAADRTSGMKISWVFMDGQGLSDIAIDNVTITAFSKAPGALSLLPKSLDFGAATPNAPDTLYATAYSLGAAPLHITGYRFSGSPSFTLISGPAVGDSIMPGNNARFAIQFLPLSGGNLSGTFTVVTDAADSGTQSVNLTGFGAVPDVSYGVTNLFHHVNTMLSDTSPEEYIPVTSIGGGPLHFTNIYFIGLNANNYYVSRMPRNPLPVDVTDSIGIRFTPTFEGRPDASVVINTDAANKPLDTISLFGVGVLPHLVITVPPPGSGNTVMFDSVAIGDSACQSLILKNVGSDTLQIIKQLVTYGDYDFTFHPLTGADTMILPGDSVFATVCFKPLKNGTRLATLRFFTNIPPTYEKPRRDTGEFDIQ
ncbi:MAG TPA: choice-of-anchor D domain-containing protein, partial [Candidatus Kapabacteria bacterium]|nr:choice-of-anchor D domain-containing protein [Candidatus Kapabacteria bacterium]